LVLKVYNSISEDDTMRKLLIIAMIAVFTVGAGSVYAKGGNGGGGGNGSGYGGGNYGSGMGMGGTMKGQGNRLPADFQPVTQEQANTIANKYVEQNMNSFEVISSGTFQGKRFSGYTYTVQDAQGNQLNLIVNARGDVRGPFAVQK